MTNTLIDLYCERTAAGFWNEPLNAMSNIAFLLAALLAWRSASLRGYSDIWEKIIISFAALIGVGSFLFHTFASPWAAQADIIPIWLFVSGYIVLLIYRVNQHNPVKTIVYVLLIAVALLLLRAFIFDRFGASTAPDISYNAGNTSDETKALAFNGSLQYLPVLVALMAFSLLGVCIKHAAKGYLAAATLIFFVALVCRTMDLTSCEATQGFGTHFLWHCLNGVVVGLLLQALVQTMPPKTSLENV